MNLRAPQILYFAWDLVHKKSVSDESRFTNVLSEAKVDLNPHQVEAAVFAFKSPLSKGAILADEVGLGKTIEAGIIMSEMWAEGKRHIIIVVPASLRRQWGDELLEKFYLPSIIIDRLNYDELLLTNENPFESDKIVICSYQFAVKHSNDIAKVFWDLAVFDEAHKLRNVYKRDNVIGTTIRDTFKPYKKILLTATPLQNSLKELYGLISIIDQNFFSSQESFNEQYTKITTRDTAKYGQLKRRISHIIHRTLRSQVQEYVNYTKRIPFVQEYYPSKREKALYDAVNRYLIREDIYAIPEKQKPLLTLLVRKIMSSSAYALSFTLERFIDRLYEYKQGGQFSSDNTLFTDIEDLDLEEYDNQQDKYAIVRNLYNSLDAEIEELREYQRMALNVGDESKALYLIKGLSAAFEKVFELGGERKALIFTESTRTQKYLYDFLSNHGYKNKIVCFNGTNNSDFSICVYKKWIEINKNSDRITGNALIDRKQALVDYFKSNAEIMIATEAGAEGINLQFCSLVVNYDMPWNPQRIEQRIGRCHRYGQKHDVVVMNFVNYSNQADRRVYQLLSSKFNLFEGVFGSSDEVLGSIESGVDFERRLNSIYQSCRTEKEISDAFDQLQNELDEVIQERIKQTRISLLENFDKNVIDKLKVRQIDDVKRISLYNSHLWELSKSVLTNNIRNINEETLSFELFNIDQPEIELGVYGLLNSDNDIHTLRTSSRLGSYIINKSNERTVSKVQYVFDSDNINNSFDIKDFNGKQGFTYFYKVVAKNKFDNEEFLISCSLDINGNELFEDFSTNILEHEIVDEDILPDDSLVYDKLKSLITNKVEEHKKNISDRNKDYVDYEIQKYKSWADDNLHPAKLDVVTLRRQSESLKRKLKKAKSTNELNDIQKEYSKTMKQLEIKVKKFLSMKIEYDKNVMQMSNKIRKDAVVDIEFEPYFSFGWKII